MNLHPASVNEIRRISVGTAVLDVIMISLFSMLGSLGILNFEIMSVTLAALGGSAIAIVNFAILCITVQQVVGMEDQKKMQAKFQLSYNIRMVIQAVWVVICYFTPQLNIFAGALPLFFPKVTIMYLNAIGKLVPAGAEAGTQAADPEAAEEQAPVSEGE